MANCFHLTKNESIVTADPDTVWPNQVVAQSQLNFSNTEENLNESFSTAVDENETFSTAIGENETQYLSVIESPNSMNDTLEDVHLTMNNQKLIPLENVGLNDDPGLENNLILTDSEQVYIFNVEGSDEIHGIQIAQDEDGNVHKYQFQFRKTDNGQLEAMPETIQLLPNEDDTTLEEEQEETIVELQENHTLEEDFGPTVYLQESVEQIGDNSKTHLLVQEENIEDFEEREHVYAIERKDIICNRNLGIHLKKEEENSDDEEENEVFSEDDYEEEMVDIKPGIDMEKVKHELLFEHDNHSTSERHQNVLDDQEEVALDNLNEDYGSEADSYNTADTPNECEETIVAYRHFEPPDEQNTDSSNHDVVRYEQLFIEERNLDELNYNEGLQEDNEENGNVLIVEKEPETNDSENEYDIVEGLPITADGEISEDSSSTAYQEAEVLYPDHEVNMEPLSINDNSLNTTNILKQPTNINKINDISNKTVVYYMVSNQEQKENLNSISLNNANPRSLLKNNIEVNKLNNDNAKKAQREKVLEKRYARSKEVIQAQMFNNFINKTTIPHAPIRQGRMPRKQEIKPVDTRRDEEIIVQEVMVSSKGFVESISERLKNLDKLEVTSIVELSDSDEDYDPKNGTKKKKKHKKTKPTNPELSDSDASVIEILNSDDEANAQGNTPPEEKSEDNLKRSQDESSAGSSPQKKSRTEESSEIDSDENKAEIVCPHCPKTFLNQNSLSTHIQHHNLENNLLNSRKNPLFENKHKCEDCQETFKNITLSKRHVCNSKKRDNKQYKCGVCFKLFKDITVLNIHKKTHIKENMVKSTSGVIISPKKFTSRPSTSAFKAPSKPPVTYKCKDCSRICSSLNMLTLHEKSHKKFVCTNCKATFASKLLLDNHIRIKCVKNSSPRDKRLSYTIRKSFLKSPRKSLVIRSTYNPRKTSNAAPINNSTNKKTLIPTVSTNKPEISKISVDDKSNLTVNKKNVEARTNSTLNQSTNFNTNKNGHQFMNKTVNPGLNNTTMMRTLDVETQCDSCTMKFATLTALFKHKVKNHGLHTPDKRVLQPQRKQLHKPLNLHGGIPAHDRLNKAFQEMRKKLILAEMELPEESLFQKSDKSDQTTLS